MRTSQDDKHCLAAPSIFYLMFSEARKEHLPCVADLAFFLRGGLAMH